jgi:5-methylcytosine-specific restriction endonuclease McrA
MQRLLRLISSLSGHNGRPRIRPSTHRRLRLVHRKRLLSGKCRCAYCGLERESWWEEWHVDHVKPVAQGGRNWNNLVLACRDCNLMKGAEEWEPVYKLSLLQRFVNWLLIATIDQPRLGDF